MGKQKRKPKPQRLKLKDEKIKKVFVPREASLPRYHCLTCDRDFTVIGGKSYEVCLLCKKEVKAEW